MSSKIVGYLRVSTAGQAVQGVGHSGPFEVLARRTVMPILKNERVEAGKIAKDDVVKGRTAAVVKIGTKFAEIRDADGKMILRAPLRQTVAILRPTPTEEEVAAQKAEREAQQREWREEAISGWLANADDRYAWRGDQVQRGRRRWLGSAELLGPVHRPGQGAGRAQDRQGGRARDRALGREKRVRADGRVRRLRRVARPSSGGAGARPDLRAHEGGTGRRQGQGDRARFSKIAGARGVTKAPPQGRGGVVVG